jgi:hypothetical protein
MFINSNKKFWFKCKNNHEFDAGLHNVNKGFWCPYCLYKNEQICREIFEKIFDKKFFKSRQIIKPYELDGYNDELKLAFEYHGEQHYYYIPHFHRIENALDLRIERDNLKEQLCLKNNIKLIIIKYNVENFEDYIINKLIKLNLYKKTT